VLRVLVLSDYFLPHASGGVERAAFEVSRRVAREGHEVTVLTFRREDSVPEEEMDGLHVVRVPAIDVSNLIGVQLSGSLHVWPAIRRLIRDRNIDVLHTHGLFFHVSLAAAVVARVSGIPLVTTAHVGSLASIGGIASQLSALYERSAGKFILRCSREIIAVSEAVATHVESLGAAEDRVTVIPNGVDTERFAVTRRKRRARQSVRMVCVGRLIANKGPQHLISALPEVLRHFPDAECWFVGDGPMRKELERMVRALRLDRNVRFLGERHDIPDLLAQCDVFVRPSLSEGMPLAVLEAMAAGLTVVATPVGGTPEVVDGGSTGFLVDPGDFRTLSERLCQLLGDGKLRRAMGARGHKMAEGYSWDVVSQKTIGVYDKALRKETETWSKAA
jgi:glycosyltransferase involved in cell wall biosynthesis